MCGSQEVLFIFPKLSIPSRDSKFLFTCLFIGWAEVICPPLNQLLEEEEKDEEPRLAEPVMCLPWELGVRSIW
jgi:hypothetical protein